MKGKPMTDEEYLDSLLKNVMDEEPKKNGLSTAEHLPAKGDDFELPEDHSEEELPISDEPAVLDELPILDEPAVLDEFTTEEEPEELADSLPIFDESNTADEADEPDEADEAEEPFTLDEIIPDMFKGKASEESAEIKEDEATLNQIDLDAMFAEMDKNIELPEEFTDEIVMDGINPEEDIMAMLNLAEAKPDEELSGNEGIEVEDLLAGMSDDEDLSDIKDLLEKDENNEPVVDDMLSLLDDAGGYQGDIDDDSDIMSLFNNAADDADEVDETKKKPSRKRGKRAKKDDLEEEQVLSLDELDAQITKIKKKGIFSRLFSSLTETDDESTEADINIKSISPENLDILNELEIEDGKKKKKEKKTKEKKEKKPKEEKPKKEKKVKPAKVAEDTKPAKRISKKKVLLVFIFSMSLLTAIIAFSLLIPDYLEREGAKIAFYTDDHRSVFGLLYAKNRNPADDIIFQQAQVILKMERRLESYEIYKSLDKPVEALDALLKGLSRYDELMAEETFGVEAKLSAIYSRILEILVNEYNLPEGEARGLLMLEAIEYTHRLHEIAAGVDFS